MDVLAAECPSVKVFGPSKAGAELEASKVRILLNDFGFSVVLCKVYLVYLTVSFTYKTSDSNTQV